MGAVDATDIQSAGERGITTLEGTLDAAANGLDSVGLALRKTHLTPGPIVGENLIGIARSNHWNRPTSLLATPIYVQDE